MRIIDLQSLLQVSQEQLNDSYFLADNGSAISNVDAIIGSFLGSESYNGEIWKSLRSRAGIAE